MKRTMHFEVESQRWETGLDKISGVCMDIRNLYSGFLTMHIVTRLTVVAMDAMVSLVSLLAGCPGMSPLRVSCCYGS